MIYTSDKDNMKYISSGLFKSDGEWCHPQRVIDSYEIIFMTGGCAYICEDGINYTLHEKDILFLEPKKVHYGFQNSSEPVSFFLVTLSDRFGKI